MKRFVILGLLMALWAGAIQAAEPAADQFATAPILVSSVRPEPVEYSPGRLIEGFVTLEITVATDGSVKGAHILYRTSPMAVSSAVQAVEKWKFAPATLKGQPVESVIVYSLPFGSNLPIFANADYPTRLKATSLDGGETEQVLYSVK
jgi:TonB family protein